jgi:hypothetical protein
MKAPRTALLIGSTTVVSLAFLAPSAMAAKAPNFAVTKLSIVHYKKTVDVATKGAKVKVRVQVKDHSKKFNPTSVKLVVSEKVSGEEATQVTVKTHRTGKSKSVTNWQGTLSVPAGAVAPGTTATYCIKLVKVNDADPSTAPVVKTAKGLAGRDCFTVKNSATSAA